MKSIHSDDDDDERSEKKSFVVGEREERVIRDFSDQVGEWKPRAQLGEFVS